MRASERALGPGSSADSRLSQICFETSLPLLDNPKVILPCFLLYGSHDIQEQCQHTGAMSVHSAVGMHEHPQTPLLSSFLSFSATCNVGTPNPSLPCVRNS